MLSLEHDPRLQQNACFEDSDGNLYEPVEEANIQRLLPEQ